MLKGLLCLCLLAIALADPSYAQGTSARADAIRIIDESNKEVSVSSEDIKTRLFQGRPVCFVEDQAEEKRRIDSEWIVEALRLGAEEVDIKNAIITGDLDLRAGGRLVVLEESGLEPDVRGRLKRNNLLSVFLFSAPISIEDCRLEGRLLGDSFEYSGRTVGVVFLNGVSFLRTSIVRGVYFRGLPSRM